MQIVIWTARIAVFLYLIGLMGRLTGFRPRVTQTVWTIGFLVFSIHVWAAFEFVHHWSHSAAWNQTAEQTSELFGWNWGGGLWFNYLFLLAWGIDVVLTWSTIRPTKWFFILHMYLAFIVVNATAVFGPAWWRPTMIVAGLIFGVLVLRRHRSSNVDKSTISNL